MSIVQLKTPRWRPIPPAVSSVKCQRKFPKAEVYQRLTLLKGEFARVDVRIRPGVNHFCLKGKILLIVRMSHSRWFFGISRGGEWGGHPEGRVRGKGIESAVGGLGLLAVTDGSC